MDLVIGGAFQGKLSWAAREYDLKPEELCDLAAEEPRAGARCCFHLEELTRRDADAARYLPQLLAADVVVSREVGSGVVPDTGLSLGVGALGQQAGGVTG